MAPGWAMAIIGPVGTLILCELSKVGPTDPRSRDSDGWRWFLGAFWVNKRGLLVLFLSAKNMVSSSEPARYSSGSIGFVGNWIGSWKRSFLGGSQKLVDPNFFPGTEEFEQKAHGALRVFLLRHTLTRASWIGLVWVH